MNHTPLDVRTTIFQDSTKMHVVWGPYGRDAEKTALHPSKALLRAVLKGQQPLILLRP
jgi:hypothetical protein